MHTINSSRWSTTFSLGFCLVVMLLTLLSTRLGFYHWNIATGVFFAALWLAPLECWWLLCLAMMAGLHVDGLIIGTVNHTPGRFLGYWTGPVQYFLGNVAQPLLMVPGVLILRSRSVRANAEPHLSAIVDLHLAALVVATLCACKDLLYVWNDGWLGDVRRSLIVNVVPLGGEAHWNLLTVFGIQHLMGHFVGIMLVATLVMWLVTKDEGAHSRSIVRAGLIWLLPVIVLSISLAVTSEIPGLAELLRLLLLVMIVLFSLYFGWRGAVMSILSVSVAVAIEDHLGISTVNPIWVQMYIAIAGAMGLLFGVAVDGMRQQATLLTKSHLESRQLLHQLRESALRNLKSEEWERQRLAGELHDEFGQNLAVLQTRIKLSEPLFVAAGSPALAASLMDITRTMRRNISHVLESLKPASLAELGLFGAIDRGSVRQTLEADGIELSLDLLGDARLLPLLDDSLRVAAYRLVQEATTNVVRHARATRCTVRLRINLRNGSVWLFIDVSDDGIGWSGAPRFGRGLRGMHDRVRAMNGMLKIGGRLSGARVHALLRDGLPQRQARA